MFLIVLNSWASFRCPNCQVRVMGLIAWLNWYWVKAGGNAYSRRINFRGMTVPMFREPAAAATAFEKPSPSKDPAVMREPVPECQCPALHQGIWLEAAIEIGVELKLSRTARAHRCRVFAGGGGR